MSVEKSFDNKLLRPPRAGDRVLVRDGETRRDVRSVDLRSLSNYILRGVSGGAGDSPLDGFGPNSDVEFRTVTLSGGVIKSPSDIRFERKHNSNLRRIHVDDPTQDTHAVTRKYVDLNYGSLEGGNEWDGLQDFGGGVIFSSLEDPTAPVSRLLSVDQDGIVNTGTVNLNTLTDVTITNPESAQMLRYISGEWVNQSIDFITDVDSPEGTGLVAEKTGTQVTLTFDYEELEGNLNFDNYQRWNLSIANIGDGIEIERHDVVRLLSGDGIGVSRDGHSVTFTNEGVFAVLGKDGVKAETNTTTGEVEVSLNAGINQLTNVVTNPSDGQVLTWVNSNGRWEAVSPTTGITEINGTDPISASTTGSSTTIGLDYDSEFFGVNNSGELIITKSYLEKSGGTVNGTITADNFILS